MTKSGQEKKATILTERITCAKTLGEEPGTLREFQVIIIIEDERKWQLMWQRRQVGASP